MDPAELLPHRAPFLLVDEITELRPWRERPGGPGASPATSGSSPATSPGDPRSRGCSWSSPWPRSVLLPCSPTPATRASSRSSAASSGLGSGVRSSQERPSSSHLEVTQLSARAGKGTGRATVDGKVACEAQLLFVIVDAAEG